MKINVKNIGKVAEADVEINGIAVVAGENGTGKSTVGKALYAAFNSMSNSQNKIDKMRRNSVERTLRKAYTGGPLGPMSRHKRSAGRISDFTDRVFSCECTRDELIDEIKEYYGKEISREIESDFRMVWQESQIKLSRSWISPMTKCSVQLRQTDFKVSSTVRSILFSTTRSEASGSR